MKRALVIVAVVTVFVVMSSLAGAVGSRRAPVPYAPGSEYVYNGSGAKIGTLTGQNLTSQLTTVQGLVSQ